MKLITANKLNRFWKNGILPKLSEKISKTKVLTTMEQVEANTNEENVTGALVVGELINDLGGCSFETREDGAYVKYTLPGGADPVVKKLGDETPQYFEGYSGSAYSMKGKTIDAKNIILLLHAHTYRHKINENIIDGQMIELGEYLSSGTDSNSNAVTIITKIFYCKSNNNTITFMNNGVEKTGPTLCSYGTYNIIKLQ